MTQIKTLSRDLQKIAEIELGEVTARIPSDLQTLRTWIEQQPHLNARKDEQFLIQFLRGCKYSLERSKQKIDLFFTLKSKYPELFNAIGVDTADFKEIYNLKFCLPLPKPLNENGSRIIIMQYEENVGKGLFDVNALFQMVSALHEIILLDDSYACINGVIYIVDLKNLTLNMAVHFTPTFLRKIVQFYENSLPLRIKGAHVINAPGFFQSILNIVLPLLSAKLRKRITVNGINYESLFKIIPQKYFPTYLRGENGSIDQILSDFGKKWSEYANYFKENKTYGTDERFRADQSFDLENMYGAGGSFRKLNVD